MHAHARLCDANSAARQIQILRAQPHIGEGLSPDAELGKIIIIKSLARRLASPMAPPCSFGPKVV